MRYLLFLAALPIFAQNYSGDVVYTFTASAPTTTSGGPVVLSWSSANWSPAGTPTMQLYTYNKSTATPTSETLANGSVTVNPTQTTLYGLQVMCPACNTTGTPQMRFVIVYVGTGALAVTQLTSAQNDGPGVPAFSPVGQMVELTYNDTVAGCVNWVGAAPSGGTTAPCTGGNVTNPSMRDVWLQCTWTAQGATSGPYTTYGFYEGGKNTGNGNFWKVRFKPETADTWNTGCIFGDPADYKVFTNTAIFTSVADPNYSGPVKVSGSQFITGTAPFYPLGINIQALDSVGNIGPGGTQWNQTYGNDPSPLTGGAQNRQATWAAAAASYANAGINLFSVEDDKTQNFGLSNINSGSLNLILYPYGAGYANGFFGTGGGTSVDSALLTLQNMRTHALVTCEAQPGATYFNGNATLNPFTSANATFIYMLGLQYCVNRYGSLADGYIFGNEIPSNTSQAYTDGFSLWIKQQDPYGRMTSVVFGSASGSFSAGPNIDINNSHRTFAGASGATSGATPGIIAAITATQAACSCSTPTIFGEWQTSIAETPPANLQTRSSYWAAFFDTFAAVFIYPSGVNVTGSFFGTPQYNQLAFHSSFVANFPAAATPLTVTISGQSCGGCTVGTIASGAASELGAYIWNETSTTNVTSASATLVWPTANMLCNTFSPLTGAIVSSFTGPSSTGSHAVTLPTITAAHGFPDLVLACWAPTTPIITTVMLQAGSVTPGNTFSQTALAQGGTGPYTYALKAGALPPGLSLNTSSGAITGSATTAGYYHFSIQATDSLAAQSPIQPYILPIMALPTIGNTVLDNIPQGYTLGATSGAIFTQPVVVGGCQPISATYTATGLPSGLSIGSSPLMYVTGTATAPGTATLTPTVTDPCGNILSGSPTLSLTVPTQPGASNVAMQTPTVPGITLGFGWSTQIFTRAGSGNDTFAVTAGTLPTGIALVTTPNATLTQIAAYTVSSGTATVSITPTDTVGTGPAQSYVFTVNAAPLITISTLPPYSSSSPYSATINTSGGTKPNNCLVSAGTLPTGYYFDTGLNTLYGPPLSGITTYPISVTCWDANHAGALVALNLNPAAGMPTAGISAGTNIGGGGVQ